MTEYRVVFPKEKHVLVDFRQDDLPGLAMVNSSLVDFEHKLVFQWHVSLLIDFEELVDNEMPSREERAVVDPFGDELDVVFRGDPTKPNALFLARVTWSGTRQLLYRAYDPEPVRAHLQNLIESGEAPRAFDYRIEIDPEWGLAAWYLGACSR